MGEWEEGLSVKDFRCSFYDEVAEICCATHPELGTDVICVLTEGHPEKGLPHNDCNGHRWGEGLVATREAE